LCLIVKDSLPTFSTFGFARHKCQTQQNQKS
jgi:hypothetical protein